MSKVKSLRTYLTQLHESLDDKFFIYDSKRKKITDKNLEQDAASKKVEGKEGLQVLPMRALAAYSEEAEVQTEPKMIVNAEYPEVVKVEELPDNTGDVKPAVECDGMKKPVKKTNESDEDLLTVVDMTEPSAEAPEVTEPMSRAKNILNILSKLSTEV